VALHGCQEGLEEWSGALCPVPLTRSAAPCQDLGHSADPVDDWLDNLLVGNYEQDDINQDSLGVVGGGGISRTTSYDKAQAPLFQGFERVPSFERVTSKESHKEMPPIPQRNRSWSITELMAVAGPMQQRGRFGMSPASGFAPAEGQQPDVYANQEQHQQQQQQHGAVNAPGQSWMGNSADEQVQGYSNNNVVPPTYQGKVESHFPAVSPQFHAHPRTHFWTRVRYTPSTMYTKIHGCTSQSSPQS
jgi:hypothetical protein